MRRDLPDIHEIWVYLSGSPLLALIVTLSAYHVGVVVYERLHRNPLANPVAIAVALVTIVIEAIDMPYAKYFEGAQFVHFLLGTATVSLAVPIHQGLRELRGLDGGVVRTGDVVCRAAHGNLDPQMPGSRVTYDG